MNQLRKYTKKLLPLLIIVLFTGLILSRVFTPDRQQNIEVTTSANEAGEHRGKYAEVCGEVVSVQTIYQIDGEPTFINFGEEYPNQHFTGLIWGEDRAEWQTLPEDLYINRNICVEGYIQIHEGTPQIRINSTEQVRFQNGEAAN
ncbi:hypothetical protein [Rhodohalobacter barkolensis]|uniref:DNA-binding protein n=1 Tax=Rhodohalobacter barkolensis TaxID=2053187 RepID=A0A2N0VHS2_9BACT|nr:hypothetical protein [Rhodohalobacter barkolensis]PKD43688.1 hypothetical protein CWD77_09000 [Rhodohalobacter barkolensis]